jgi:hypothetical protein
LQVKVPVLSVKTWETWPSSSFRFIVRTWTREGGVEGGREGGREGEREGGREGER